MLRIKNILFPTDFSICASQALDHALFLAKRFGAQLHMVHAIVLHQEDPYNPAHQFPDAGDLHEKMGRLARERMGIDLRESSESDETIDILMEELRGYSVADLILEYAHSRDIDLIVMGTHGRRGIHYMFLGSVAQEIVREAPCPVYTIRESETPREPRKTETILSPVDFSDHSRAALSIAREAAELYDAKLQILHVVERVLYPSFYEPGMYADPTLRPDFIDLAQKELRQFFGTAPGPDVTAEFHVAHGHVVHEILEHATSNRDDLIVIATHGLTGLKHLLLGSVAEKVIRSAPCPVLTVKAFGINPIQE